MKAILSGIDGSSLYNNLLKQVWEQIVTLDKKKVGIVECYA